MCNIANKPQPSRGFFNPFTTLANYGFSLIRLNGKKPVEKNWTQWCETYRPYSEVGLLPGENAGVACGPASNLIVLDIDDPALFEQACREHDWDIPETYTVSTSGRGSHYYFRYPQDGRLYGKRAFKKWGFDIQGKGAQVVAAGSTHPDTGQTYTYISGTLYEIADPPAWLIGLYDDQHITKSTPDTHISDSSVSFDGIPKGISERIRRLIEGDIPIGERSEPMMSVIVALVAHGMSDAHIV